MKIFLLALTICCYFFSIAQPLQKIVSAGMSFGSKTDVKGAINADQLASYVKNENSIPVKVKGKVVDVCTKQGCWLKMEPTSGNMMVKMKDHSFFVPLDLNGKQVVVVSSIYLNIE